MADPIKRSTLPVLKNTLGVDYEVPPVENYYGVKDFTMNPLSSITTDNVLDEKRLRGMYNTVMGTRGNSNVDTIALSPDVYLPPPPPPTVAETVANNQRKAYETGGLNGNIQAKAGRGADMAKTLMGGDMGEFMGNLLRMFAQPEFQQAGFEGQGFGPTVLGATKALRAMDTQDAEMEKARLEALANVEAAGSWDAKSFQVDQLGNLTRSIEAAGTINSMKELISGGLISGGPAGALTALRGFGELVGISLDPGMRQKYEDQVDQLATALVSSGIFGREVNKSEWDTIFNLIAKPAITKGDPVLLGRLNSLLAKLNKSIQSDTRSLEMQGVPVQKLLEPSKPLFTRGN